MNTVLMPDPFVPVTEMQDGRASPFHDTFMAQLVFRPTCKGGPVQRLIQGIQKFQRDVLVQLQNLQTHPSVLSRLAAGPLRLYGWIYDIGQGTVESFDAAKQSFVPLDGSCSPEAMPVARPRRYVDMPSQA